MDMKLDLKRMNQCSFQTAIEVWNEGFQGYFVDLTMSLDSFLTRLSSNGISPEFSFVAFLEDRPVGFLLNAFRHSGQKKLAWNGGTGVVPAMRGKGVGKVLVNAALDLYREQSVDIAMLEAITANDNAIALYRKCGYDIVEELVSLHTDEPISAIGSMSSSSAYKVQRVAPAVVGTLKFYQTLSAWQTQWQCVGMSQGSAIIVLDHIGKAVGYALFNKRYDQQGTLSSITLYQCEIDEDQGDVEAIAEVALQHIFLPEAGSYRCMASNLRKTNKVVVGMLRNAGFTTFIEQVHMMSLLGSDLT